MQEESKAEPKLVRRGEIYWADLGPVESKTNVQKGYRTVVVISNDVGNRYSNVVIVVPCTTKHSLEKPIPKYATQVELDIVKPSIAMCEQIMVIDKSQLEDKVRMLTKEEMTKMDNAIKLSLHLA